LSCLLKTNFALSEWSEATEDLTSKSLALSTTIDSLFNSASTALR